MFIVIQRIAEFVNLFLGTGEKRIDKWFFGVYYPTRKGKGVFCGIFFCTVKDVFAFFVCIFANSVGKVPSARGQGMRRSLCNRMKRL